MPRTLAPRADDGFTLIEVLITTAIIAIVVIGVVSTFTTAFFADRNSQQIISSRHLAQEVMESMSAVDFDVLLGMDGNTVARGELSAAVSVAQVAAGLIRVEVLVTHTNIADVNTRVVTVVADRG